MCFSLPKYFIKPKVHPKTINKSKAKRKRRSNLLKLASFFSSLLEKRVKDEKFREPICLSYFVLDFPVLLDEVQGDMNLFS